MPQAPTKKPAAPGSTAPKGPTNPAVSIYPPLSGKTATNPPGDKSDPWRGGPIAAGPQGKVVTKGAVPVKNTPQHMGNQGEKNSHTQPGKIKQVGPAAKGEALVAPKIGMKAMNGPASKVYPHLTKH